MVLAVDADSRSTRDELRVRNAELEAIFRALPDLLFELSPDGAIVRYRAGNAEDLYRAPQEFLGLSMMEVLPPEAGSVIGEALERVNAGESLVRVEYDLSVSGISKHFEARLVPMEGGNVIVMARDVTEQRDMQEERRRLDHRMFEAQRLESLGLLAGGIAHDFNNLLAVILGGLEIASRNLDEASPLHASLDLVWQAARRGSDLSRQLLAYAGKGGSELRSVDLVALVRDTAKLLEAVVSKRVALRVDLPDEALPVVADAGQLRQLLLNLVTNASDSCGVRGGSVAVRVRSLESDADSTSEPRVELEVIDDGCGMDPEIRERIFDPFFTTKGAGRGLGLAPRSAGLCAGTRAASRSTASRVGGRASACASPLRRRLPTRWTRCCRGSRSRWKGASRW